MHNKLKMENSDMQNSSHYFQYWNETGFPKEKRMHGFSYILFFSLYLRTKKIELFYYTTSEKEKNLDVLNGKIFHLSKHVVNSVEDKLNGFNNFVEMKYDLKGI